jgi:hypothetical protein
VIASTFFFIMRDCEGLRKAGWLKLNGMHQNLIVLKMLLFWEKTYSYHKENTEIQLDTKKEDWFRNKCGEN